MRIVPPEIQRPPYADGPVNRWSEPRVKSPDVIARMRRACRAAAEILAEAGAAVAPGVTTDELDALVHEVTIAKGGYPSPLNYGNSNPYPKSVCTSVNEVICHGIPDDRALIEGDIVNLDVTIYLEGVHGDCNATFPVGQIDDESRRLIEVTRECLERAIAQVGPGQPFNLIGKAIEEHAHANKLGVVRDFVGHGIGEQFHTDLQIPHYYEPRLTTVMETGMTFTIEPMITIGDWRARVWDDGWTAVTADGSRTAQFEHTVLVTDDGVDVLTR
jgi:methionyl aminopeptidase